MYATKVYSFHLSSEYSILTSLVNKLSLDNNKHIPYTSHVCMYMACTVKPFQLFVFCSHQQMEAEHENRGGIHKSHKVSSLSGGPLPPQSLLCHLLLLLACRTRVFPNSTSQLPCHGPSFVVSLEPWEGRGGEGRGEGKVRVMCVR